MMENYVKTVNATYKLLDFFPDNDPLKYKAKERALKIMENLTLVSNVSGWVSLQKEKASAELLDDIEILKNYMKLGKSQGWVGGINFLILLKEYDYIKSQIIPPKGSIKNNLEIALGVNQKTDAEKPPLREKTVLKNENPESNKVLLRAASPETVEDQSKLGERQEKILRIISSRGKAQVSDIIKEIPNVTKRTIRRDLDELLKKAKVVRSGEWNSVSYQIN